MFSEGTKGPGVRRPPWSRRSSREPLKAACRCTSPAGCPLAKEKGGSRSGSSTQGLPFQSWLQPCLLREGRGVGGLGTHLGGVHVVLAVACALGEGPWPVSAAQNPQLSLQRLQVLLVLRAGGPLLLQLLPEGLCRRKGSEGQANGQGEG